MIKVRPHPTRPNTFEGDIRFQWPDRTPFRERLRRIPGVTSESAAERWLKDRETSLLAAGKAAWLASKIPPQPEKEIPTLEEFWPRFIAGYCKAERQKASGIEGKERAFRNYLRPHFGTKRLDQFRSEDIQRLKQAMADQSPKSVNNVLTALSAVLKYASPEGLRGVDGVGVISATPCRIRLLKVTKSPFSWYEVHDYRRLVDAAAKVGPAVHLLVLLAGSAGLRRGEIMALKWTDLDIPRRIIHVNRSIWSGVEDVPKGGRGRDVTMTEELATALARYRHLGERVLQGDKGKPISNRMVRNWIASAQRRAGLEATGAIHMLRHTFCSHLAAAGVPARAIQELAGHADIQTTQRYMHLSPNDRSAAIAALGTFYSHGARHGAEVASTG